MGTHLFSLLPELPRTTPLRTPLLLELEVWLTQFDPYSDFNAASLWAWDVDGTTELARCDDALVVRFPSGGTTDAGGWSVLGAGDQGRVIDVVLAHALAVDGRAELTRVPECVTSSLDAGHLTITIDRDHSEALYELLSEADYRAPGVSEPHYSTPLERDDRHAVLELYDRSAAAIETERLMDRDLELRALERLLSVSATFATVPTGTWIDGQLVDFSIDQLLTDGWAVAHFAADDGSIDRADNAIAIDRVVRLVAMGVQRLNGGRDLGRSGLRSLEPALRRTGVLNKSTVSSGPSAPRVLDLNQIEQKLTPEATPEPIREPLSRS